jgi:hypothetical protein
VQSAHKFFHSGAIVACQRSLQGMTKRAFQTAFPAVTPIVQIGAPPGQFASWVYLHTIDGFHNTNHLALGQDFTTAHARPLGYMFYTLDRFLRHLHLKSLPKSNDTCRWFDKLLNISRQPKTKINIFG